MLSIYFKTNTVHTVYISLSLINKEKCAQDFYYCTFSAFHLATQESHRWNKKGGKERKERRGRIQTKKKQKREEGNNMQRMILMIN
jgi:hypothetical protein